MNKACRVAARRDGVIGSSLGAELGLHCSDELKAVLDKFGDELRFAMITSYARIHPLAEADAGKTAGTELDGLKVFIAASAHEKRVRCWHHREDVGSDAGHGELCGRCVANVSGRGEMRAKA